MRKLAVAALSGNSYKVTAAASIKEAKELYDKENGEFDLYSYGLDRQPGGEGENSDVVSWE